MSSSNLPTKLPKNRIGPFLFRQRYDASACRTAGVSAACLNDQEEIIYDPGLSLRKLLSSMIHETAHEWWGQAGLGIKYPDGDPDSPGEKIIRALETPILEWIMANPEIISLIQEAEE